MKILSIGNSFSEDAQRYLHGVAEAAGVSIHSANLMIGGCSLERHYENMLSGAPAYGYQENGVHTGRQVSLSEGLAAEEWDVVTLQQVSQKSPYFESYLPYLTSLASYVRKALPRAKLFLHETWAYEDGSHRLCEELGYKTSDEMIRDIRVAYRRAAREIAADGLIPSGEMLAYLHASGVPFVHRDTFHASYGVGRYALACLFTHALTGKAVTDIDFRAFDVEVTKKEKRLAEEAARAFTLVTDFTKE